MLFLYCLGSVSTPFNGTYLGAPRLARFLVFSLMLQASLHALAPSAEADSQFEWKQVTASTLPARYGPAMVYDNARQRTVLFGGRDGTGSLVGDTWVYDGTQGQQVSTIGPSPRFYAAIAYDSARAKIVLFGGYAENGDMGDTWEWDGAQWKQVATTGPSARFAGTMAYDSNRGKCVLFGDSLWRLGETWEWDGIEWRRVATTGPSGRESAVMIFDSRKGRTVLYGGWDNAGFQSDTWEWDGSQWQMVATSGPGPRNCAAMTYDSTRGKAILFGGDGTATCIHDDTWEWDGTQWNRVSAPGPAGRRWAAMAYDSAREKVILAGGYRPYCYPNDSHFYDDTWEFAAAGAPPFRMVDAVQALQWSAGLSSLPVQDRARFDVESTGASAGCIDHLDAARIARKVAGLEANP